MTRCCLGLLFAGGAFAACGGGTPLSGSSAGASSSGSAAGGDSTGAISTSSGAASSGTASGSTTGAPASSTAGAGTSGTTAGTSGTSAGAGTSSGASSSGTTGGICANVGFVALPHTAVQTQPFGLAIADYNGDGIPDYAVANYVQNSISLVLGLGDAGIDGGFAAALNIDAGQAPRQLSAVDYNKDGRPDLVIPLYNGVLATWTNQGTWSTPGTSGFAFPDFYSIPVLACPGTAVAADMNRDGWPDIVFSDSCYRQVGLMLNLTDGGFATPVVFPAISDLGYLVVVDFNGDGWPDVAATSSIGSTINLFSNTQSWGNGGAAGLGNEVTIPNFSMPGTIATADVNGDGWADLVVLNAVSNTGNNGVVVYLNLTDGGFAPALPFFTGGNPQSLSVGDFNHDQQPDLAVATGAAMQVLLNTGAWSTNGGDAGFGPLLFVDGGATNTWVDVQDLNGDGWADIAVLGGTDDGYVSAFINTCGNP